MFVAAREVTETLPDGGVVRHPKGTIITQFSSWDYAVQKALLRRGDVTQAIDVSEGEELVGPTTDPAPSPAPSEPLAVEGFTCPHCPDRLFANRQGLRLHLTRMHPAEAR